MTKLNLSALNAWFERGLCCKLDRCEPGDCCRRQTRRGAHCASWRAKCGVICKRTPLDCTWNGSRLGPNDRVATEPPSDPDHSSSTMTNTPQQASRAKHLTQLCQKNKHKIISALQENITFTVSLWIFSSHERMYLLNLPHPGSSQGRWEQLLSHCVPV